LSEDSGEGETYRVDYWVDANVLLRFLTGEPEELAGRAESFLESAERDELTARVHQTVVAETVWVLQSFYEYSKKEIAESLISLLERAALTVDNKRVTLRALQTMAEENVDFLDALLAQTARARKESIASFDRKDFKKLSRKLEITWLEPGEHKSE
jgi:predicted nucleic-acid-binding protein